MIFILWCIAGLIHLAITGYLAIAFFRYQLGSKDHTPKFSIVIAAHNEEENLKKFIPVLLSQSYKNFEIIIGLDRCTDESEQFLKSIGSSVLKVVSISEVPDEWNPKKYALSKITEQADGDWLIFTDADCVPNSNQWLDTIRKHINEKVSILIGLSPYKSENSFLSSYISFEAFHTGFLYIGRALQGKPYMGVGRNMAIRKFFFESSNKYDSIKSIQGGDDDLFIQSNANRSNTSVYLGKDSLVTTYPKKSWKEYFIQKLRHLSVAGRYKPSDQLFLTLFHVSHLLFLLLFFINTSHIFFFPVLLFYLFIKLVSYRFAASKMGVQINYILLPLVDMLYAVLTPVIAMWSKLVKDITWKN
ncbi:glycosyltransferase [Ekhidna sp.]|uniref:glycosyltransferase n=1 Tax=Ekhidna sp. TaxID=2608089 RepID=UPI0032ED587B